MDTAKKQQITPTIKEQILLVRDTGEANMFDCHAVMSIANREEWYELVDFLSEKENRKAYSHFILTGQAK